MNADSDRSAVSDRRSLRRRDIVLGLIAILALHVALVAPNHFSRYTPAAFLRLSLEGIVILALLTLAKGRWRHVLEPLLAILVALALVLKLADAGAYLAFARPFNPVLDAHLLDAAMNLLSGAIGRVGAIAVAVLAAATVVLLLVLALLAVRAAGRFVRALPQRPVATLLGALALAWAGLAAAGIAVGPRLPAASLDGGLALSDHASTTFRSLSDLSRFRQEAAVDAFARVPDGNLLTTLRGRDVILVFVESYGRTVLDNPEFAPSVTALLDDGTKRLAAAGLSARSAYLTSSTIGGQSWLAHATLLSGLWVDNQIRHDSLMTSKRMTLNAAFERAGWRTVGLMPAITMAWPEGAFYGYDALYPATDLGYKGKPFNWVTMPDQYVWSALRSLELDKPGRKPVMAEMALVSSHAPWTPVPRLIPWAEVGNGHAFDAMASEGDPPSVVWKDTARVRRQYRETIEYALATIVSYAETFGLKDTVLIVLGDHQPAPLVTGEDAGHDVPIHIITGDPDVLRAIDGWGWTGGLTPAENAPAWPMNEFRDRLLAAFTPGVAEWRHELPKKR